MRARTLGGLAAVLASLTVGALPAGAADPAHDPVADCGWWSRNDGVLAYVGYARAPLGHASTLQRLRLVCTYTSAAGQYTSVGESAGPVAVTYGGGLLGAAAVTVCTSATATYSDGHVGTFPEQCETP